MELPFSPSFFKSVDAYQRLKMIKNENKSLWKAELLILSWAYGPDHQHTGSAVPKSTISDALQSEARNKGLIQDTNIQSIVANPELLMSELTRAGYTDTHWSGGGIIFNDSAYLAGKVIIETNLLTRTWRYEILTNSWWLLFILGILLLISQIASNFHTAFNTTTAQVQTITPVKNLPTKTPEEPQTISSTSAKSK